MLHSPVPEPNRATASDPTPSKRDSEIEDAATILEFLAWGRRKNPGYSSVDSPQADKGRNVDFTTRDVGDSGSGMLLDDMDAEGTSQLSLLQLLLPNRRQVYKLVEYHGECLLWSHGSYFAPSFRKQLDDFYDRQDGSIENPATNLQWVALLFSILTGSMTCAPVHQAESWGFGATEQEALSKRWSRAVITCLNYADYTAKHTIFSVQAIATFTISAHLLGHSNTHSVLLASAIRIAQSLGMHRLSHDAPGSLMEKETGRRVWSQLCTQDWFGIPFSESYLINPLYSQSEKPRNCHDHDLVALPDSTPTITSYCRFHTTIAAIMPQLQDGMTASNTPYTKYEQVLRFDKQLRSLATAVRPLFLSSVPLDPSWPAYVPWARRALAISSSHKIIMIHRKFLGPSFTNPAFAYTRRTCLAASKTIIREYKLVVEEDGPILWTHQAFSVAACIILCLDLLHRKPSDREYDEQRQLVEEAMEIFRGCYNSMIAIRGVKLLSSLLAAGSGHCQLSKKRKADAEEDVRTGTPPSKQHHGLDVPAFVRSFCEGETTTDNASSSASSNPATSTTTTTTTTVPSIEPTQNFSDPISDEGVASAFDAAGAAADVALAAFSGLQFASTHSAMLPRPLINGGHSNSSHATIPPTSRGVERDMETGRGPSLSMPSSSPSTSQHGPPTYTNDPLTMAMGVSGHWYTGFKGANSFENLLYLANHDFPMPLDDA